MVWCRMVVGLLDDSGLRGYGRGGYHGCSSVVGIIVKEELNLLDQKVSFRLLSLPH
jgi:hypothetical protein